MAITAKTFDIFEQNLYNAQASSELAELRNNPQTKAAAKKLFDAIHETRNALLALTDQLPSK